MPHTVLYGIAELAVGARPYDVRCRRLLQIESDVYIAVFEIEKQCAVHLGRGE